MELPSQSDNRSGPRGDGTEINEYNPETWNTNGTGYAEYLHEQPEPKLYPFILDSIASAYEPGMKILEVGCAGGHNLKRLLNRKPIDDYTGLDVTEAYLEVARKKQPLLNCRWVQGDARSLPFEDKEFDITFCLLMLLHLDEEGARKAVQEMCRVTKKAVFIHTYLAFQRFDSIRFETLKGGVVQVSPTLGTVAVSDGMHSFLYNVMASDELVVPGWKTELLHPFGDGRVGVVEHKGVLAYIPNEVDIYYEVVLKRNE